jgi:hypothetical protein
MTDTMFETEEQAAARIQAFRLRRALEDAPEQVAFVHALALSGRGEAGETLREWSAPMRISAADAADETYAQLVNLVAYLAEDLNLPAPAVNVFVWRNRKDIQGFRAGTTTDGARLLTHLHTAWLLIHAEQIATHPEYPAFAKDTGEFLWELRSQYPMTDRKPRDVFPRACPICDEYEVGARWGDGDAADVTVECGHCGQDFHSSTYRSIVGYLGHVHHWRSTGEQVDGRMLFECGPDGDDRCGATGIEGRPGIDRHAVVELTAPGNPPETSEARTIDPRHAPTRIPGTPKRLPRVEPEDAVAVCQSCWITPCVCGGAS